MANLFESTEQSLRDEVQEKVHKIAELKSENVKLKFENAELKALKEDFWERICRNDVENARLTERYEEAMTALDFYSCNAQETNQGEMARALIAEHAEKEGNPK